MKDWAVSPARNAPLGWLARLEALAPTLVLVIAGACLPLFEDSYLGVIGTRAAIYWVLVSGLNLVVGFAGQIAIGWVALLTLGAYVTSVLTAGTVVPELSPYVALAIAGLFGAIFGVIVGLPALRLRTFYFATTTLGFATIVTQVALAWKSVTGGGVGVPGPIFTWPFASPWGFYCLCLGLAVLCTWMTANIAASRFGRALVAIRDAEVAAEAVGISKPALLVKVFLFSGAVAAIAGGLFASLQSYITPDAFTFDLSLLFFIAILIGGRGSILIGPNGSGKTTTLNVISGYYAPQHGRVLLSGKALSPRAPHTRAGYGIARTFQTPRLIGAASVLDNVMIGGTRDGRGTFMESLLALSRHRRDEAVLRQAAMASLATVGLEQLAHARSDRLQHGELRFVEIARALMLHPSFLLLDEPAAGLSVEEIKRLGDLIVTISRQGTGVLLVEHHADLIFDICDRVTVLNLGKVLASGTPAEIRAHREVVNAYLGA